MQAARKMVAVFVLLALAFGASVLPASAGESDAHVQAAGHAMAAAAPGQSLPGECHLSLPGECHLCSADTGATSIPSCSVVGCLAVLPVSDGSSATGFSIELLASVPDQTIGKSADSPEPHPPRLTVRA
jgi:hypothetical protein